MALSLQMAKMRQETLEASVAAAELATQHNATAHAGLTDMAAELAYTNDEREEGHCVLAFHAVKQKAYFKLVARLQAFCSQPWQVRLDHRQFL